MDKLAKALKKMPVQERLKIKLLLKKVQQRDFYGLDLKKLAGQKDIYRLRQGDYRVIFRLAQADIFVLAIERRSDNTYSF